MVVIGAVVAVVATGASQKKHDPLVSRIAFGSCSDQSHPQVFFFSLLFPLSLPQSNLFTPPASILSFILCLIVGHFSNLILFRVPVTALVSKFNFLHR
jgi:hypothetical protein